MRSISKNQANHESIKLTDRFLSTELSRSGSPRSLNSRELGILLDAETPKALSLALEALFHSSLSYDERKRVLDNWYVKVGQILPKFSTNDLVIIILTFAKFGSISIEFYRKWQATVFPRVTYMNSVDLVSILSAFAYLRVYPSPNFLFKIQEVINSRKDQVRKRSNSV